MESQNLKKEQKRTEAKKKLFLAVFSMTLGQVAKTCQYARIHRDTYYDWCRKDSGFATAVKTAGQESEGYFAVQAKNDMTGF
jgi:hypothetical protein